jgi:hypothetical protein
MSEGSRPGGLTALAVFNLIFGSLSLLSFAGNMVVHLIHLRVIEVDEGGREKMLKVIEVMGESAWTAQLVAYAVCGALLLASGIGYLKQKRFLGRKVGNGYAIVSIAMSALITYFMSQKLETGVTLGLALWVIYPVLTLILLNTTFKEDFVR